MVTMGEKLTAANCEETPRGRGELCVKNRGWLTRDPIGISGGINLYGYVDSSPVCAVDPGGMSWWPDITPNVNPAQSGIPSLKSFNAAVQALRSFKQRPGESRSACLARLEADHTTASRYMLETFQQSVAAESYALYQEGVLNALANAEWQAEVTAWLSGITLVFAGITEAINYAIVSQIAKPVGAVITITSAAANAAFNVEQAISASELKAPPQYHPEFALLAAMAHNLDAATFAAIGKCHCRRT